MIQSTDRLEQMGTIPPKRSLDSNELEAPLNPDYFMNGSINNTSSWARRSGPLTVLAILIVCVIIGVLVGLDVFGAPHEGTRPNPPIAVNACAHSQCGYTLVETIPLGFDIPSPHPSTYVEWLDMINGANQTIDIAAMYMTLTSVHDHPGPQAGAEEGGAIYDALIAAARRGVAVRIAASTPTGMFPNDDLDYLNSTGLIDLRYVGLDIVYPSGMLHTKFMVVDHSDFYVGSANFDWRSLTQVKEFGLRMSCPCFTQDLTQIFEIYWAFAEFSKGSQIPPHWPSTSFDTPWNWDQSSNFSLNGTKADMFISVAPPVMVSKSRTSDLDAVLWMIGNATKSIDISVMDYAPAFVYTPKKSYWPDIDDALRTAAFNGVTIQMIFGIYNETTPQLAQFAQSLNAFPGIEVKFMHIPYQTNVTHQPFTRVNHNKMMVTDRKVWVGTSNWSADYFFTTAGVSVVSGNKGLREQVQAAFDRDWNSNFSINVAVCSTLNCPSEPPLVANKAATYTLSTTTSKP